MWADPSAIRIAHVKTIRSLSANLAFEIFTHSLSFNLSPAASSRAGALPVRVIFPREIAPRNELEHCRDVLAFETRLGISTIDEIRACAGQMLCFGIAEEMVIPLDA